MAALDLSDMQDEVRQNIKRDSAAFADTRATRHINWAQYWIAAKFTFEEMRKLYSGATVADQQRYSFPDRMKDIYSLRLIDGTNSRKLRYLSPREFDERVPYPAGETTSRSTWYVDYGTYFELFRIPDDAYTLNLRCSVFPADLADATPTGESDLTSKDELIVARASATGFRSLRQIDDADYWDKQTKDLLVMAMQSDHSAEDWTPIARPFAPMQAAVDYRNPWAGMP